MFSYIQQNLMNVDDGCNSSFNFNSEDLDNNLWNSDNPEGTVFDLDIPLDDGAVITSYYSKSPSCYCWTFSTITNGPSTRHPVSGNRQFALKEKSDGTWSFYTQGADRATNSFLPFGIDSRVGFLGADMLWDCVMDNIEELINSNGGNATGREKKTYRPNWRRVEEMLNQLPIDDLIECLSDSN